MKLFTPFTLGKLELRNRVVMAPMTRSRAIGNVPNDLMAMYYGQRAGAGLIVTEGVSPSPNGLGYPRIPGMFSEAQTEGWKKVTETVHAKGTKIFIQFMHTGRASHPDNLPVGAKVLAPSAIALSGEMYTDTKGMQAYPVPHEMTKEEIKSTQKEFAQSAKNAIAAGFDGVELHGANGYLIDQFLNPASNQRHDEYGGSIENRSRFAIEVAQQVAEAIGGERTGIRLSPYGAFNDMASSFDGLEDEYTYLAAELGKLKLAYIHTVDHSSQGAPIVPESVKLKIKRAFGGTIIASGGMDKETAEEVLQEGRGDLIAFGRPFLGNPDLVSRMENDNPIVQPDYNTLYTPGEKGYTDYPSVSEQIK
jgi:N-ethylmaleimide reductase